MDEFVSITANFVKRLNSSDSSFCVCLCNTKSKPEKIPTEILTKNSKKGSIDFVVIGYALPTYTGIDIKFTGSWESSKYGTQFKVASYEVITPETEEGMYAFLSCGRIKGIGPRNARAIIDRFGKDSLDVLENTPEKLLTIRGIGEKKLQTIIKSYKMTAHLNKVAVFLGQFGIGIDKSLNVYEKYGLDCVEMIKSNPYLLTEVEGIGFLTADKVAQNLGIMLTSDIRIEGALNHLFEQIKGEGNLYCETDELKKRALNLLNTGLSKTVVTSEIYDNCMERLFWSEKFVRRMKQFVFSRETDRVEKEVSQSIYYHLKIKDLPKTLKENYSKEFEYWKERQEATDGVRLSDAQKRAVKTALTNKMSIITGCPGTGKTTIVKTIIEVVQKISPLRDIVLLAPTGKAARRMAEVTKMPASTIHKQLGIFHNTGGSSLTLSLPEEALIIVDETSMVDIFIANLLFKALPYSAQLILVGDPDQLPSVGPGNVLREMIRSKEIPVVVLDKIYRQGPTSSIAENSARINAGNTVLKSNESFCFCQSIEEEETQKKIIDFYVSEVERVGIDNVAILCPTRKRGAVSVNELNKAIQEITNPQKFGEIGATIGSITFRRNDRVIQTKNTEAVSNGDVGVITRIDAATDEDGNQEIEIQIDFEGGVSIAYSKEEMKNVDLAYALTIHKSQGAEFKTVICPILDTTPEVMLKRNLLYTAVSRAKDRCILIGSASAIRKCILTNDVNKRKTFMADRIHAHRLKGDSKEIGA